MAEPQRDLEGYEPDTNTAPELQVIEGGEGDAPRRQRDAQVVYQGLVAVLWGAGAFLYGWRMDSDNPLGYLLGIALVLAGGQHAWRGMRGTAPAWGPRRRLAATVVATLVLMMIITAFFAIPQRELAKEDARPTKAQTEQALADLEPVVVPLEADSISAPAGWKHEPEFSDPGAPSFSTGDMIVQVGLVGVEIPVDGELDAKNFGVGVMDTARGQFPGYRLAKVEATDVLPDTEDFVHTFVATPDGTTVHVHQLMIVDRGSKQIWNVTAASAEQLDAAAVERLHRDVERMLPIV